jgi:organic hydroperoxide reductase OsmC/OhrA
MSAGARTHEFEVTVDPERIARSGLGGEAIPRSDEWWPEHLALVALVRCTLASLDFHARRANLQVTGSGRAHGVVRKRAEDGLYAFVEIETNLEVELSPAPGREDLEELLARAERGCFVGNSLTARPHYEWTVNGETIA